MLSELEELNFQNSPALQCYPSCLANSVQYLYSDSVQEGDRCPTDQEQGLCGIISSTDVASFYSEWSCGDLGIPLTNPCGSNLDGYGAWSMVNCEGDLVIGIDELSGLSGTFPRSINKLTSLTYLDIHGNDFIAGESEVLVCCIMILMNTCE
jgi:hypothetical protein